ncbi:MAG: hypothetical protein K2M76_07070, partial [Muribaculaceae bacterium]|nr:hypothetical protein [Muribaculaceae bacterium]
ELDWLGLAWDEGGIDNRGCAGPYMQSHRGSIYTEYLQKLKETGYTYPCTCTRADIMATQAPHQSDGRVIYGGRCRPGQLPIPVPEPTIAHATRLYVPDEAIWFTDVVYGQQYVNLATHCGDFVLQRADGAWAYQLAVVVDDALMGVTEVVRGNDLLLSTGQQLYLYRLLGLQAPAFAHVPLLCNVMMQRLSKRDASLSMEVLRRRYSASEIIGHLALMANLIPEYAPVSATDLVAYMSWSRIPAVQTIVVPENL